MRERERERGLLISDTIFNNSLLQQNIIQVVRQFVRGLYFTTVSMSSKLYSLSFNNLCNEGTAESNSLPVLANFT